jgi:hypothetical protein
LRVYILLKGYDYDQETIVKITANLEEAKKWQAQKNPRDGYYDYEQHELDLTQEDNPGILKE